jgi:hypothetical protein
VISFKDRSFCSAACLNTACEQNLTPELQQQADDWWGKPGAPIAFFNYSELCGERQTPPRTDS